MTSEKPIRIQRKRVKGWRLPPNTKSVTRPGPFGNPFKIGGWFMVGDPNPRAALQMSWCQARDAEIAAQAPGKFTLIESAATAVEFFDRLCQRGYFKQAELSKLRGYNLACYCRLDQPCHADILLKLANAAL